MNFAFSNLLGAPYRGGNLCFDGKELLTAVGNRVSLVRLCTAVQSASVGLYSVRESSSSRIGD